MVTTTMTKKVTIVIKGVNKRILSVLDRMLDDIASRKKNRGMVIHPKTEHDLP